MCICFRYLVLLLFWSMYCGCGIFYDCLRKSIASGESLFVAYDLTMFVVAAATPFLCGWFHERYPIASGVMVLLRFVC